MVLVMNLRFGPRLMSIIVAGAFTIPCTAAAQRGEATGSGTSIFPPADSVEVLVTRTEVRVRFARDTARRWGWSANPDSTRRLRYAWSATIEGTDGPRSFDLVIKAKDTRASTFPSLDSLVRMGITSFCQPGMAVHCFPASLLASVEDRRVVLRYRDSVEIARLFGLRPASATIMTDTPEGPSVPTIGAAPIRYLEPGLLPLGSAGRVEAVAARRNYDASVNRMYRYLSGASWLEEGDSTQLGIEETHCVEDVCAPYQGPRDVPRTWGTWSSSDTTIARLHRTTGKIDNWRLSPDSARVMTLVALKPGRTTIRASGVHDPADLEPSRLRLDSVTTGELLVTPRVGRLTISPRPTTLRTGERRSCSVLVLDRAGRTIEGTPVQLRWGSRATAGETAKARWLRNISQASRPASEPVVVSFDAPGRYEIIAVLGANTDIGDFAGTHADTVNVDVLDEPKR
jgi:hypothetical protein